MQSLSDDGQGGGAPHAGSSQPKHLALARRQTQALDHIYSYLGHHTLLLAHSYLSRNRLLLGQAHVGQFAGGYQ